MNCLLVMKIKWSLDINTGAVERSEAARVRRLAGATVVGDDVIASTGYMKKQPHDVEWLLASPEYFGTGTQLIVDRTPSVSVSSPHLCVCCF